MAAITTRIVGLEEAVAKLSIEHIAGPARKFLERCGEKVRTLAVQKAPVDNGILKNDISFEVDEGSFPRFVKIGTNLDYAKDMEGGTGILADLPGGTGAPHWPPGPALDPWALRHGFESGYQVARIIGMRGGLEPRRFLRGGLEEATVGIESYVSLMGSDIEAAMSTGAGKP